MDKHFLLRRISIIHAIKCTRSESFEIALTSFDKLGELKELVMSANEINLVEISNKVDDWAGENPVASNHDINSKHYGSKNHY